MSNPHDSPSFRRGGPVGIFSTEKPSRVAIQRPLTKDEAMAEAVSDVEWSLDGLQDFQNPIISCAAIVPAIPISLCKQAVGAIRGLTRKQYQVADAQLSSATRLARPEEGLACLFHRTEMDRRAGDGGG